MIKAEHRQFKASVGFALFGGFIEPFNRGL
jgi:hypothetical protein